MLHFPFATILGSGLVYSVRTHLKNVTHNNGHDDTIDGYSLTENDTNKILCFNSRCFDSTA